MCFRHGLAHRLARCAAAAENLTKLVCVIADTLNDAFVKGIPQEQVVYSEIVAFALFHVPTDVLCPFVPGSRTFEGVHTAGFRAA